MNNFREVNEDILKEWLDIREQETFCTMTPKDREHSIYFDEVAENILKNVSKQNKKYVQKQLDKLDDNFMDYLSYWNEKYYRNGVVDGSQLVMGCFEEQLKARLILALNFYFFKINFAYKIIIIYHIST